MSDFSVRIRKEARQPFARSSLSWGRLRGWKPQRCTTTTPAIVLHFLIPFEVEDALEEEEGGRVRFFRGDRAGGRDEGSDDGTLFVKREAGSA